MLPSNPVSTIFRCISCSFGTCDQTAYAEHIKLCSNESSSEAAPSDDTPRTGDAPDKVNKCKVFRVCRLCLLPTDCSRALRIHERDVHGNDARIFACTLCSRFASHHRNAVYKHARLKHPDRGSCGKVCVTLGKESALKKSSASRKAAVEERSPSEVQKTSRDNSPAHQVKSSKSLGLQFIGKQLPVTGRDEYVCQLCSFSHVSTVQVVNHIRKDHRDMISDFDVTRQASDGTTATNVLYQCDDCDYSTRVSCTFYNHCSQHQFRGPSKCAQCSYSTLTESAIVKHVQKCHANQHSADVNCQPKQADTKISAPFKRPKSGGSRASKNQSVHKHGKQRWFHCPFCRFKTAWRSSLYKHKLCFHVDRKKATASPPDSTSSGDKSEKTGTGDTPPKMKPRAPQQKLANDSLLPDVANISAKQNEFKCDICSAKFVERRTWQRHKMVHSDLRCFRCPLCGLRGNYRSNINKHIASKHKGKKLRAVRLSLKEAKRTIEAYKKQFKKSSPGCHTCSPSTGAVVSDKALQSAFCHKSKAAKNCTSALEHGKLENIPDDEHTQERAADTLQSRSVAGAPKLQKCYACSICTFRSRHLSSAYRHNRAAHDGKAKMNVVRREKSAQQSKLAVRRKISKGQNADGDVDRHKLRRHSRAECVSSVSGEERVDKHDVSGTEDTSEVSRYTSPVQWLSVKHKLVRRYACGICPFRANAVSSVIAHRKLHVRRTGCTFECKVCPYFCSQSSHLLRHMRLHAADDEGDAGRKSHGRVHLCEHCPFFSTYRSAVTRHRQLHVRRASASIKCERCPLWTTEMQYLGKHSFVHSEDYMKRRLKYGPLPPVNDSSDVVDDAVENQNESASRVRNGASGVVGNTATAGDGKLVETSETETASEKEENGGSATAEEGAAAAHLQSSTANLQLPSWCCERCPYSAQKHACFKRHAWLHGKEYAYGCNCCDYSVQSYWQLVSHVLWHSQPNKHLVYAQPVSNLDSLMTQLSNRGSIPDSLADIDKLVQSFENSDVLLLSDAANFECRFCPFATDQRSRFFAHMLRHCVRATGDKCPHCNFRAAHGGADAQESRAAHVLRHFNLPGDPLSSLPPNLCHSHDWKQLESAIAALTASSEQHPVPTDIRNDCDLVESASSGCATAEKQSDSVDNPSADKPQCPFSVMPDESDHTYSLSSVLKSEVSNACTGVSASADSRCEVQNNDTSPADNSLTAEPFLSADGASSAVVSETTYNRCCYCDIFISEPDSLAQHVTAHLLCSNQPLPP